MRGSEKTSEQNLWAKAAVPDVSSGLFRPLSSARIERKRTMKDNVWRSEDEYLHDNLLDFTIIGAAHMNHGLTQFPAWSKAMLAVENSEDLRPFLRVVYANSKTLLEKCRKLGLA
jgi:hypothetical protein